MNNSQCVILVPANNGIEPACDHALRQLERLGYPVWRVPAFAAIDAAQSQIPTDAVARSGRRRSPSGTWSCPAGRTYQPSVNR